MAAIQTVLQAPLGRCELSSEVFSWQLRHRERERRRETGPSSGPENLETDALTNPTVLSGNKPLGANGELLLCRKHTAVLRTGQQPWETPRDVLGVQAATEYRCLGGLLRPSGALQTPPRGRTPVHTALLPRGTHLAPPGQVYNNAAQGFRARHTLTMAAWLLAQILKSTASATHPPRHTSSFTTETDPRQHLDRFAKNLLFP